MAIGLVKWWRARFLAGYKPFSVVGGGAEASDSEELLASAASPCNSSPPPVSLLTDSPTVIPSGSPTSPNDEQTKSNPTRQLSFEEFECDVSVAEGDRRRQEFSFTLYDFDGHGKITKDDIAGLVTTIYDTLGASIQVPPCGSKTIKVKLTVSPDQRTGGLARTPKNTQKQDASCCRHMKQSCDHGYVATRRVPRRRRAPPRQRCKQAPRDESHSEDDVANEPSPANDCKQEEIHKRVGPVPNLASSPCYNSSEGDISDDSDGVSPSLSPLTPLVIHHRKRNGDMQRQQLLEIIQANMEKNNLSFHATRKRPQSDIRITYQSPPNEPSSPCMQRQKHRTTPLATRHVSTSHHKPVRELNNQQTPKFTSKNRASNARKHRQQNDNSAKITTQSSQTRAHIQSQLLTHNSVSPADVLENQQLLIDQGVTYANNFLNKCNDTPAVQQQQTQQQPLIGGKPSKKHLLKHATREQDQARAMAQVVRWLEREFSQNSSTNTTPASRRHVHEHIHHHYHHYHAEALV